MRERADGMYHVITYLCAKMFDELLLACLCTLPVAAWTFYGVQLVGNWGIFWLVYYLTLCNGIGARPHHALSHGAPPPCCWFCRAAAAAVPHAHTCDSAACVACSAGVLDRGALAQHGRGQRPAADL